MLQNEISFSIENTVNPNTNLPFGTKYGGTFRVKRASLMDKTTIANKEAAERNAFGVVNPGQTAPGLEAGAYFFHYVTHLSIDPPPAWFDRNKFFDDDDEAALFAVYEEVRKFQDSFRSAKGGGSGAPTGQQS